MALAEVVIPGSLDLIAMILDRFQQPRQDPGVEAPIVGHGDRRKKPELGIRIVLEHVDVGRLKRSALIGIEVEATAAIAENHGHFRSLDLGGRHSTKKKKEENDKRDEKK